MGIWGSQIRSFFHLRDYPSQKTASPIGENPIIVGYGQFGTGIVLNLENYFPVLLFILVGIGVGLVPMALGKLIGPNRPDSEKVSPYECGFEAFEDARMKFDVRYYLIAILFILFDLETAFLFPWGVALSEIGWAGYISMFVFLLEFVVGFAYIWKKGALNWE